MYSTELECCVLQFAKLPEIGRVKTRMQPALTELQSLALHRRMTTEIFRTLSGSASWDYQLWASHQPGADFFQQLRQEVNGTEVCQQQGQNLGARMSHALQQTLRHYKQVVIVGSDCPFLTPAHMQQLFTALQQGCDCALIPANDGGYVAIAASRYAPALFENVVWGGPEVLQQTQSQLQGLGWRYICQPSLPDIDRPQDLQLLRGFSWWQEGWQQEAW